VKKKKDERAKHPTGGLRQTHDSSSREVGRKSGLAPNNIKGGLMLHPKRNWGGEGRDLAVKTTHGRSASSPFHFLTGRLLNRWKVVGASVLKAHK